MEGLDEGAVGAAPVLRVGTAMWAHPAWPGRHTPETTAKRGALAAYASWCSAVEGNTHVLRRARGVHGGHLGR